MVHLTDDKIKELLEDEDVVKRISDFVSMGEAAFFEEVRLGLSQEELEEYLEENPDERKYLDETKKARKRAACQMTNRPSSGSSSK